MAREPGSRRAIDMTFLYTWGYTAQEHAFFIENIILFMQIHHGVITGR